MRLGLRADLIAADASQTDSWWDKVPFDAVLLDLPCSATGVIRRKPDVRLMRSEATLKSLLGMQAMILDATWRTQSWRTIFSNYLLGITSRESGPNP